MKKWFTILLALVWLLPAGDGLAGPGKTVVYEGKLQDANRKPIGGIFPLSFALHRNAKKGRSLWKEEHFVAIDEGRYEVQLGSKTPIPSGLDVSKLYLSVSVSGGNEIVRERLATGGSARKEKPNEAAGKRGRTGDAKGIVEYAETAGLAYEAEHAKVADRVGDWGQAELEDHLKNISSKVRISSSKRYTGSAGGEGGVTYELKCPKGHVVTGVRGGSGIYLDSIQLICSPLE
tara:strand:+ start:340 stop:1038 length:699 start_codon:yes stop_codon:yes gene_type:complete